MNKFMLEKIDVLEESAGYEGLDKEIKREKLYVNRMKNDDMYKNDRAIQDGLQSRTEYIEELEKRLKKYNPF